MPRARDRKRYSPPAPRPPRVPKGERVVRQGQWFTTDHPETRWYQVLALSAQGEARLLVANVPEDQAADEIMVVVQANGRLVLPVNLRNDREAIRVIATALKAYRR